MGIFTQTTEIVKAQFEAYLLEIGTSCTWKRRASVTPSSETNDAVQYTGHLDPQETAYARGEWNNTTLYPANQQSTILICKDVPNRTQAENAGQMVTASTVGYTSTANAVAVGDYLIIGSEAWYVSGARLVSPPIYRELTLEKRA